jgi:hypothetical protein
MTGELLDCVPPGHRIGGPRISPGYLAHAEATDAACCAGLFASPYHR